MGEERQSVTEMPCVQWVGQTLSEIRGTLLRALSHRSPLTHHSHTHPGACPCLCPRKALRANISANLVGVQQTRCV